MLNLLRPNRIPKSDMQGWPAWNFRELPVHPRWTDADFWIAVKIASERGAGRA